MFSHHSDHGSEHIALCSDCWNAAFLSMRNDTLASLSMSWEIKALRFGGTCSSCGATIEKNHEGLHNKEMKIVRCITCGTPDDLPGTDSKSDSGNAVADPIAGSSALRDGRKRRDANLRKGAVGEYLTDRYLSKNLPSN